MLPTPETTVWSSRIRLTPEARCGRLATNSVVVELRVERVAGDVRDLRRQVGAAGGVREPAEHPLVDEAQLGVGGRRAARRTRRCRSSGAPAGWTSSCPLIPRCASTASPLVERQPEVLAAAAGGDHPAAGEAGGEVVGTGQVPADGAGVQDLDPGHGAADDVRPRARAGRPRPRAARARSGQASASGVGGPAAPGRRGDRAVGGLGGLLLGLLLGPAGAVAVERVADAHLRGEGLLVVGALVLDDVLRDAEGVLGGELLQAGLPVQAGAEARRGLASAGRTAGGRRARRPRSRRRGRPRR